jgi:hypothetical protein
MKRKITIPGCLPTPWEDVLVDGELLFSVWGKEQAMENGVKSQDVIVNDDGIADCFFPEKKMLGIEEIMAAAGAVVGPGEFEVEVLNQIVSI